MNRPYDSIQRSLRAVENMAQCFMSLPLVHTPLVHSFNLFNLLSRLLENKYFDVYTNTEKGATEENAKFLKPLVMRVMGGERL